MNFKRMINSPNLYANCMQMKSKKPHIYLQGFDFQVVPVGHDPTTP